MMRRVRGFSFAPCSARRRRRGRQRRRHPGPEGYAPSGCPRGRLGSGTVFTEFRSRRVRQHLDLSARDLLLVHADEPTVTGLQGYRNSRAIALDALELQPSAMRLRDAPADRQPQPGSSGRPCPGRAHPVEPLCHLRRMFRRYSYPRVSDGDWYEDETDAVSRELHSAGLLLPQCGAHVMTPWETVEAHLALAWVLNHDLASPPRKLVLSRANLNRTNAFLFCSAFWTEPVRTHDGTSRSGAAMYFPIDAFDSLGGEGGHRGPTPAFMASLGVWSDWTHGVLAGTSD